MAVFKFLMVGLCTDHVRVQSHEGKMQWEQGFRRKMRSSLQRGTIWHKFVSFLSLLSSSFHSPYYAAFTCLIICFLPAKTFVIATWMGVWARLFIDFITHEFTAGFPPYVFYGFALTCFITFQSGLVKHGLMHVPKLDLRFINLCYHKSLSRLTNK